MDKTDRDLLELAAKAAEMGGGWDEAWQEYICPTRKSSEAQFWRPLTDDGDALRLAVKLGMDVTFNEMDVMAWPTDGSDGESEPRNVDDPYAATRRAIVRAAAQLGDPQ